MSTIGQLPALDTVGQAVIPGIKGLYVGSTIAPSWQDRIAVGDLGYRTTGVLTRYPEGIMLQRSGGHRSGSRPKRSRRSGPNAASPQGADPRRHPGDPLAAARRHRDRHRLPRRRRRTTTTDRGVQEAPNREGGTTGKAVLVLEDGRVFTGASSARSDPGRGGVLHRDVRLPGDADRSELSPPDRDRHRPQIGNTGWNPEDGESRADKIWVAGYAVRDPSPRASNWRATGTLDDELVRQGVVGIAGIDTRGGAAPAHPRLDEGRGVLGSRTGHRERVAGPGARAGVDAGRRSGRAGQHG
jgi:hypothetical protein